MPIMFNTSKSFEKLKYIKTAQELNRTYKADVGYVIIGKLDITGLNFNIEVPEGGISLHGIDFNVSGISCSDDNYTLFSSPLAGSGDIVFKDFEISITGNSSKVYDLSSFDGQQAIEITACNYTSCTSLGEINNYRQILETGTGRLFGTPELTLSGLMNGYRIDTSIAFGMSSFTSLFKAGVGLQFSSRFITDINCNLPATGALFDFTESNFLNDESFFIQKAVISREGIVDPTDSTIIPNITSDSVKSIWKGNTGIRNTNKYFKAVLTSEVETVITLTNTYYPLLGTFTVNKSVHFDSPSNGEFRVLTGSGDYRVSGDLVIKGTANDVVDIRITRSINDGLTFPEEINHIRRVVNNIVGARDVAFFPLDFIIENFDKNQRIRIEVELKEGSTDNVTVELDSYLIISEI